MAATDGMARDPILGLIDATPEADEIVIRGLRAMPGWRKFDLLRRLNALGTALALADVRSRHPEAGERECLLRLASRCMDGAILRDLCGWDVEVEGY